MDYRASLNKIMRTRAPARTGFTLLESLVALYVLTYGIVGALTLVQQGLATSSEIRNQLEATNLAREGIELIDNKRASNVRYANDITCRSAMDPLKCLTDFDARNGDMDGIKNECSSLNGGCAVWWGDGGFINNEDLQFSSCGASSKCNPLRIQPDNSYVYGSGGKPSIYTRTITVDKKAGARTEWYVTSRVEWQGRFGLSSVKASTYLSPWL